MSPPLRRLILSPLVIFAAMLGFAGAAQAATVTVGSPLTGGFAPTSCTPSASCTALMAVLPESGAKVTSPVEGVVVRWRILQGSPGHQYQLRVLTPNGGTAYTATGTSSSVSPTGAGIETFATALPIKAGQTIGLDLDPAAKIGLIKENGASLLAWSPAIPEGPMPVPPKPVNAELAFNADVQPRPTVSAISLAKGSFKGGASVTITGTDFIGVSAVSFGSAPATSFSVDSEGQVTAVAPRLKAGTSVPVNVTTAAGTGTSATLYRAAACVVPKLKGKKVKAARKKLKKAECKLGKITGKQSSDARIAKQSPKPGKKLAPGSRVKVTLG
jgi:IPT/TIG domain/PASTA domain